MAAEAKWHTRTEWFLNSMGWGASHTHTDNTKTHTHGWGKHMTVPRSRAMEDLVSGLSRQDTVEWVTDCSMVENPL